MRRGFRIILVCLLLAVTLPVRAQFREEAFSQNYQNPSDTTQRDTTDRLFSFEEFFGGVAHKRNVRIGTLFAGSTVFIGSQQIHNRQYWKLPIFYGGIAAGVGTGVYFNIRYKKSLAAYEEAFAADPNTTVTVDSRLKTYSTIGFVGAGLTYWSMLMDGHINYKRGEPSQHPGRATIYSLLLPGLGQIYNKEYWKIPIYWGAMAASAYFYSLNSTNYQRYKRIHNEATDPEISYSGPVSGETALYYRDLFRRYRDWSVVALLGSYLLNVIDANVFAYMMDFQVTDDLSMRVEPAVLPPDGQYAWTAGPPALGLRMGFSF